MPLNLGSGFVDTDHGESFFRAPVAGLYQFEVAGRTYENVTLLAKVNDQRIPDQVKRYE